VARLTASEAKAKAKDLGINVEDKYFDQAAADQAFWLLTDKTGSDGLGTDIVTNVDVLRFGDKEVRLKVFKDTENGFYQGTDYDDKIEIEVSEDSYAWNTFVEAGKGDDTVIGSVTSDTVILGAGDDFADGGSQEAGDTGAGDMGHGMSMGGGNTGDVVEYQGEFDRYVVTTVNGDDLEASSLVSADFLARIEALDAAAEAPQYLIPGTKITVVQDTVTGKNSTGTDVLINLEKLRFSDGEFNLAVTSEMWGNPMDQMGGGEVNWRGTLGDDRIVDTTYDGDRGYITSDRMDGDAGNDLMISGAGGDRLIGGIGNDIMDGGANAALTDQNSWNIDETIDIAEYSAEIDRFELEKITFEGKTLSIKDANGNLAYMMTPKTKGETKIGQIFGVDDQGKVGTSVLYQVEEGDTFIVVSDTLPESYGGVGTDILINMEKAQFGYDWEGNVEFQVKYETHTWGGGEGQVDARGTIFDDVIDLRAGKASDFSGGFGGFDDFNTGADIWDGEAFFDAIDNQFDDAVGGFDLWNWQPNASDTPLDTDVSTLAAFYAGDTAGVAGPFDIYQIELPLAGTFSLVAYSRDQMRVVEEVIARDANGDKITLSNTGQDPATDYQVFYPDTAADATMPTSDAGDIYNDSLETSKEWTRVAENQSISWTDGSIDGRKFDVYEKILGDQLGQLVAAEFGFAFEPVTEANGAYVFKPIDMGPGAGDANQGADDFFEYWQPTAETKENSQLVSIYDEDTDGNSFELGKVYDIYIIPDPFASGTTYLGAYNTQTSELEYEVQLAGDGSGKFFIKPDSIDPGPALYTNSVNTVSNNVSNSENARLHNSFVQGGRGNDIILAGQGRDEIEGGIGDDFIDGGSESDFLSKFVDATAKATKVKLEDPETGTPGVYSVYADGSKNWAWDGEQDNPSYFEVELTEGAYGIKLAEDGFDFNAFNNDRFNSYDVAFYNGAQVRYDISEVYLKLDAGRPDLKSDGSYQVLTTDAFAAAAVSDKIGYKKVVKVNDLLPAVAGGEGTDYLLNIEAIRFHDDDMDGEVQLEQDSWYFANEMPVSDWAWSPEPNATSSGAITEYTSYWGGAQTKWNDDATWNLYTYNADQGISAVYEENTSVWIQTFVQADGSGGYRETYDNIDWSFTPANDAVVVASIDTYATEWGGTNDKWNDNSDWNLYETSTPGVYAVYATETYGWLQGFVQSDDGGGYKEATQISYEGGTNGTIRDDVIVSPNREQKDQIFGKEGDDLIDAGKAIDRIKGGAGDDVIWGGTNVAAQSHSVSGSDASSYIEGDVAYYSSSQDQYTVIRNVYVKAAAVGGEVGRDASGRAKIYGDGAIPAKGVVVDTTTDAMTEANGYHAATIVIDRLTDAAGGEGVDVLIGIEGLAFGA
ncbi:hypothetical protein N9J35_01670, partial [bacterium]|nr:hypothetical protein [bacterium]